MALGLYFAGSRRGRASAKVMLRAPVLAQIPPQQAAAASSEALLLVLSPHSEVRWMGGKPGWRVAPIKTNKPFLYLLAIRSIAAAQRAGRGSDRHTNCEQSRARRRGRRGQSKGPGGGAVWRGRAAGPRSEREGDRVISDWGLAQHPHCTGRWGSPGRPGPAATRARTGEKLPTCCWRVPSKASRAR